MRYTKQFQDGSGINLSKAMVARRLREAEAPEGWVKHTPYHWARELNGKRLDYWPSKDKWSYDGAIHFGDVEKFIEEKSA